MRLKELLMVLAVGAVTLAFAVETPTQSATPQQGNGTPAKPPVVKPTPPTGPNMGPGMGMYGQPELPDIKINIEKIVPLTPPTPDTVLAKVNGEVILAKDVFATGYDWFVGPTLDEMILYKLIDQEARKNKINVTNAEIKALLEETVKNSLRMVPPGRTWQQQLQATGMPVSRLKARARVQVQLKKIVTLKVNLNDFVHVRQILIKAKFTKAEEVQKNDDEAKAKIESILKQINEGMKFEDAAKEFNEDPSTKATGGDLFFRGKMEMDPAFADVAFKLKTAGDIGGPIKTVQGYHLIQLIAYGKQATPAEKKELTDKAVNQMMGEYIYNLQEIAKIINKVVPAIKPSAMPGRGPQMAPSRPSTNPTVRPGTKPTLTPVPPK